MIATRPAEAPILRARSASARARSGRLTVRSSAAACSSASTSGTSAFSRSASSCACADLAAQDQPAGVGRRDLQRGVRAIDRLDEARLRLLVVTAGDLQLGQQDARLDVGRLVVERGRQRTRSPRRARPSSRPAPPAGPVRAASPARRAPDAGPSPAPPKGRARPPERRRARGASSRSPRRPRRRAPGAPPARSDGTGSLAGWCGFSERASARCAWAR